MLPPNGMMPPGGMPPGGDAMNPLAILQQVLPHAANDIQLAEMAARLGPPPTGMMPQMGGPGVMRPPGNPLVPGKPMMTPPMGGGPLPMTQGEARTSPGHHLLPK